MHSPRFSSLLLFYVLWFPVANSAAPSLSGAEPLFVGVFLNGLEEEPINHLHKEEN